MAAPSRKSAATLHVWARLIRSSQAMFSAVEADLARQGFPPLGWYDVLLELERAGEAGLRPFELEKEILIEQYNLSRLLARLVKAGHVDRRSAEEDGRGARLRITQKGRELRRAMWPAYAASVGQRFGALTEADTALLSRLLGKLIGRP